MITGLLLALAPRTPIAANDTTSEGHKFPPQPRKRVAATGSVVRAIKTVAVAMTVTGLALIGYGTSNWSFDPVSGLKIQTASISFTHLKEVCS